jgi:hypothetical protein
MGQKLFCRFSSRGQEEEIMSLFQVALLGEPIVKHSEQTLIFSTRKALALLVYLAVEGGTQTRKSLSERGKRHGQDAAGQRICRLGAGTRGPGAARQGLAYQQTTKTAGSGNFFLFLLC